MLSIHLHLDSLISNMYPKHERILGALQLLDGAASIDELARASGISNRDINNSLRTIEPEFVTITGTKSRRGDRRDDPKMLRLTDEGHEVAKEASVKLYEDKPTVALHETMNRLRARVTAIEDAHAALEKENRKLKRILLDEL